MRAYENPRLVQHITQWRVDSFSSIDVGPLASEGTAEKVNRPTSRKAKRSVSAISDPLQGWLQNATRSFWDAPRNRQIRSSPCVAQLSTCSAPHRQLFVFNGHPCLPPIFHHVYPLTFDTLLVLV